MSDNFIVVVPQEANHIPSPEQVETAVAVLRHLLPDAETIDVVEDEQIQFFDCGGNFEAVFCPHCKAELDMDWWGETMSADFDEETGFRMAEHALPCCGASAALNTLRYSFHQAFGRFALSVMSPNVETLTDQAMQDIETALSCKVSIVYQHL